jgi:glutamine synthetase
MREALSELEGSDPIRGLLGERFVTAYATMRRYELQRFENHVTDWDFAEYAEIY